MSDQEKTYEELRREFVEALGRFRKKFEKWVLEEAKRDIRESISRAYQDRVPGWPIDDPDPFRAEYFKMLAEADRRDSQKFIDDFERSLLDSLIDESRKEWDD